MAGLDPTVQVALITTLGTFLVAILGLAAEALRRHAKALDEVRQNTREAKEQVVNSHSTNLRDDIDDLRKAIEHSIGLQHQHGKEIAGLRADLRLERQERLEVSRRLDSHLSG